MKRLILVIVLCVLPLLTDGETVEEFSIDSIIEKKLDKISNDTFSEGNLIQYLYFLKVPNEHIPYILAQAKIESGSESGHYTSRLFLEHNNLFGMSLPNKRSKQYIKDFVIGDNGKKKATYEHWTLSVMDYLDLIYDYHSSKDRTDYLKFLDTIGYCELGEYTQIIDRIINQKKTNEIITKAKGSLYVL